MFCSKRHLLSGDAEQELHVSLASVQDIASSCDIVSLHVPVTPETTGLVDAGFLTRMKDGTVLVNTAREEIVDNEALAAALEEGSIGAAGPDTLAPEPVQLDNPLLNLGEKAAHKLVLSPHIGGVTAWHVPSCASNRLGRHRPRGDRRGSCQQGLVENQATARRKRSCSRLPFSPCVRCISSNR